MPNRVCDLLGIRYPIVLGGLARVGTAPLAAAVSEAGGLGLLGAGGWDAAQLDSEIRRVRSMTGEKFGVNIPVWSEHAEDLVATVIRQEVPVVSTSAGNPQRFTRRLQDSGVIVLHVIATVKYAAKAAQIGVDAIVAEGCESGGRTSLEEIATMALVPQVVDAVSCPVLAAGGIGDGRGLAAALSLGADGVQIGTAFMATQECEISNAYKHLLLAAAETDTRLYRRERDARRAFKTEFFENALQSEDAAYNDLAQDPGAQTRGTGQIAGLIKAVRPVREVVQEMVQQACRRLAAAQTSLDHLSVGR